MNKQSIREIFDNISLSVISFLENHIGITDVEFTERQGKPTIPPPDIILRRSGRDSYLKVGGRKRGVRAARRLQGIPADFRWAQSQLENQEKRSDISARVHAPQ